MPDINRNAAIEKVIGMKSEVQGKAVAQSKDKPGNGRELLGMCDSECICMMCCVVGSCGGPFSDRFPHCEGKMKV